MLDNDRLKYLQAIPPPLPPPPPPPLPLPPTCVGKTSRFILSSSSPPLHPPFFIFLISLLSKESQPLVIPILDYQLFHASQPTDRILRPFSERHVLVTPGSFFKHQLIHETLEDELLSFQRIQEDEKAFFVFNGQSSLGQDDALSVRILPPLFVVPSLS
jgi:hypothetical protein